MTATSHHRWPRALDRMIDAAPPKLTAEQELELARAARAGSVQAAQKLCAAHIALVRRVARPYLKMGADLDDLTGEGMLALATAATRFNPDYGSPFASYAAYWIAAYMRRFTRQQRRIVRLPDGRAGRKILAHMRRTQREIEAETGTRATSEAVAERLGVPLDDVLLVESGLSGRDVPTGGERQASPSPTPEDAVLRVEAARIAADEVAQGLEALKPRERLVLLQRYLADDDAPRTLRDLGAAWGVSGERVRQLDDQAKAALSMHIGRRRRRAAGLMQAG